jgi:hypothetical protein
MADSRLIEPAKARPTLDGPQASVPRQFWIWIEYVAVLTKVPPAWLTEFNITFVLG